jgi:hypothetical protein
MKLVRGFKGGQMEFQNKRESRVYRGEISAITVVCGVLHVIFKWLARGDGDAPNIIKWVKVESRDYDMDAGNCLVGNMGPAPTGGGDRISINFPIFENTVVLYPPDGSKLDPAKVEGFIVP